MPLWWLLSGSFSNDVPWLFAGPSEYGNTFVAAKLSLRRGGGGGGGD